MQFLMYLYIILLNWPYFSYARPDNQQSKLAGNMPTLYGYTYFVCFNWHAKQLVKLIVSYWIVALIQLLTHYVSQHISVLINILMYNIDYGIGDDNNTRVRAHCLKGILW